MSLFLAPGFIYSGLFLNHRISAKLNKYMTNLFCFIHTKQCMKTESTRK